MRAILWVLASSLMAPLCTARAEAKSFELIYPDSLEVTMCYAGCGIRSGEEGFALIANHGSEPITMDDLRSVTFASVSSDPTFQISAFLNLASGYDFTPILPGEVMGGVKADNPLLQQEIRPGETFRNVVPYQFLFAFIDRLYLPDIEGPVSVKITMTMGSRAVQFVVHAKVHTGDFDLKYTHATRVISVPLTDPAQSTTWGRIRQCYRR